MNKVDIAGKIQSIEKDGNIIRVQLAVKTKYNEYDLIDIEYEKSIEYLKEGAFIRVEGELDSYIKNSDTHKQLQVYVVPVNTYYLEEETYENKVRFKGILDKDAFGRKTAKGRALTNLFLKQERFTGMSIKNIYVPVVLWNQEAEDAQDLKADQHYEIDEATLHTREYEKDGIKRKVHELVKGN